MLNRVVLVGRLTKDIELRYTSSNVAVAQFTIAVNRTFSNQSGEREADFVNCVAWRNQAENMSKYVKKGALIGVDGRIQTRSYDDATGKRVYVTEVVADSVQFLEPKGSQRAQTQSVANEFDTVVPPAQFGGSAETMNNDFDLALDISDDDLPF